MVMQMAKSITEIFILNSNCILKPKLQIKCHLIQNCIHVQFNCTINQFVIYAYFVQNKDIKIKCYFYQSRNKGGCPCCAITRICESILGSKFKFFLAANRTN